MDHLDFVADLHLELRRCLNQDFPDNYDIIQLGPYRAEAHREDLVGAKEPPPRTMRC